MVNTMRYTDVYIKCTAKICIILLMSPQYIQIFKKMKISLYDKTILIKSLY